MGQVEHTIVKKLTEQLTPAQLEVINESNQHNVPAGSESHFKVTIVSDVFDAKMPVARHRMIYSVLEHEMKHQVHALALHCYTPKEWECKQGVAPDSPPCLGGSKFDKG